MNLQRENSRHRELTAYTHVQRFSTKELAYVTVGWGRHGAQYLMTNFRDRRHLRSPATRTNLPFYLIIHPSLFLYMAACPHFPFVFLILILATSPCLLFKNKLPVLFFHFCPADSSPHGSELSSISEQTVLTWPPRSPPGTQPSYQPCR